MHDRLHTLTDREKETLRLLIDGHDAKSAARQLDLSVHTINERLREARRKLGVSSSREAARLLIDSERPCPQSHGYKRLGVAADAAAGCEADQATGQPRLVQRLVWFGGGMLIMLLIVAIALSLSSLRGGDAVPAAIVAPPAPPAAGTRTPAASLSAARTWLGLVDAGRWEDSWKTASSLFRSQLTPAQWQSSVEPLRRQMGAPATRSVQDVTRAGTLPGLPAGDYEVLQFRTRFAHKPDAIETVALVHGGAGWQVIGYFIK